MAPSPPHTSFPESFSNCHLSCIVFLISPPFPSNYSQNTSPPSPSNPYSKHSPWADHMPARFDLWEGGASAETELAKRPVFHPFIWHLKSNYTNMLHCKTRAHCSKFRLAVLWHRCTEGKKQKSTPMISLCTDTTVLTKCTNVPTSHNGPTSLTKMYHCTSTKYELCYEGRVFNTGLFWWRLFC